MWSISFQYWPFGYQFSSVAQSCLTLCNPMNHSTPGLPAHHQLLEFTQTAVHWVGDVIQPSHPLSSPSPLSSSSPPALNLSSIRVFSSESVFRIRWPKYWEFHFSISPSSEYSGLISFRLDWLDSLAVQGTLGPFRYDLNQIPYDKPSESESRSDVSDSLWHHGLYSPWNSPGQNTGVGSFSLLQGIVPT